MNSRAYSLFEVKDVDDEQRVIRGMATTPTTDRVGDIVESMGIKAAAVIPLFLYHDSRQTVGTVRLGKPTPKGVPFEAQIPKVLEPGRLKDRVDEAWQMVKYRLIAAVSIGFKEVSGKVEALKTGGLRFIESEVFELSLVPIPANAEATISSIKAFDSDQRAASGHTPVVVVRLEKPPGVTGKTNSTFPEGSTMKKSISDQIAEFTTRRAAAQDRATEIVNKTMEEGRTRDEAEKEAHAAALAEVKEIDEHVAMLKEHEKAMLANAKAVPDQPANGGGAARGSSIVSVKRNLLPGTAFTRYAMILAQSKGNLMQAEVLARRFDDSTPEVSMAIKAAVAAGTTQDTTWAAPLVQLQDMQAEFIEFLRPMTLLGRIPGLRRVPFNIKFTRQTAGTTGTFVGEGLPKPLGKMDFEQLTLTWAKAATIIVMTEELVRFSSPSAEALARDDLAKGIATYLDKRFIDPSFAGVANVSPASITNGVTPVASSGTTIAAIDTDVEAAIGGMVTANLNLQGLVWVMNPRTALSLSMKRHTDGNLAYPGLTAMGGTFMGYTVITSNNVALTGSPTDSFVVLMDPSEIMLADDGQVSIDMSSEASVEMSNTPTGGATSLVSLWQNNLVGLRAERFINWRKRQSAAVAIINDANW